MRLADRHGTPESEMPPRQMLSLKNENLGERAGLSTSISRQSHSSAATESEAGIGHKQIHQRYSHPRKRSRQVKKRQVRLCLVDRLQQFLKDRTDS
jgi:hypothetical protein